MRAKGIDKYATATSTTRITKYSQRNFPEGILHQTEDVRIYKGKTKKATVGKNSVSLV